MNVTLKDMQATAAIALLLMGTVKQPVFAQAGTAAPPVTPPTQEQRVSTPASGPTDPTRPAAQGATGADQNLPANPEPKPTEPLYLRDSGKDYTHLKSFFPNPIKPYTPTSYPAPRLGNTPRLDTLLRDGKIYLSLSDAVLLALENNFDIEIARVNLDIADTDILRAKTGATLRGVSTGLVATTLGGSTSTITGGGGPGGTTSGAGSAGTGASGLVLSTNGGGPLPENLDPALTGNLQYEATTTQESSTFITGTNQLNTDTSIFDFGYTQGFISGTALSATFNNSRQSTNSSRSGFSPQLSSTFRIQATQHLLQGFGPKINGRFIVQAKNNRRITDSAFRQQLLYSVNQVENIYWGLVSAYEDEQSKERALAQSTQLTADNRRQLQIGTLAPLDVVNSDAAVATDQQSLVASKSNLEYQQLIMKQAIARNLEDPVLTNAPIVPTDRVALDPLPEESMSQEDLVKQAYINSPQIEQATLNMKNNEITIRGEKNGLLPVVDAYAFYGANTIGGSQNALENCNTSSFLGTGGFTPCTPSNGGISPSGYGTVFSNLFNSTAPDKGVGVNITIPIRNRVAQADQARSQMEYRQAQMRLQQIYTQVRIQVVNGRYALTNDRAQVSAAEAGRKFAAQSLDAEQKKYKLGASTTALVLQQQRNLATSENTYISAEAAYARDRAALRELLSSTLDQYGISLTEAATGTFTKSPVIPGLTAPAAPQAPPPITVGAPPPQ
jgi:outer membrane protein